VRVKWGIEEIRSPVDLRRAAVPLRGAEPHEIIGLWTGRRY
jgi:hypothetical protein